MSYVRSCRCLSCDPIAAEIIKANICIGFSQLKDAKKVLIQHTLRDPTMMFLSTTYPQSILERNRICKSFR